MEDNKDTSGDNKDFKDDAFNGDDKIQHITQVSGLYKNWFLDYASYVILERAVPYIEDGLKPVQRRILHSMWELEDGRYNKVANLIGNTMKYHPHGDASIGDALVQLGQKDLLIDMQGNWGNTLTGDNAAAPRYIEARLSKFALEVAFNPKTTEWQSSYDGRNKEPIKLPIKFPLLLAQGVEGIAVGLACKILPHNFNELIDGSIAVLKGKKPHIVPDFPTGGLADFTDYNDGLRGGKIRVRAKVSLIDKKTILISEIPFSTTTTSVIDSIISANDKGKIKVRKVEDNTSENVEILVHLPAGVSPDKTIDALYAFTQCEIPISPNAGIIENDRPRFVGVNEMLRISTNRTLELLKLELEIELRELQEHWHFSSLEKIFIKEEMYIDFKKYSNKETLFEYLYERFKLFRKKLLREINDDDLDKLTRIPMIRITRFDSIKADDVMKGLEDKIEQVKHSLANLVEFAINYFKELKVKYGKGRERKTEIKTFDNIVATQVVAVNAKLYVNREEGFAGSGMKKDEFVCDCSDIDDIIVFRSDGVMVVTKISDKAFVGKGIIHIAVFRKNDERSVYNMIYRDGPKGDTFIKRFSVTGVTRDKEYELTRGNKESEVLYFTANPNGESEVVTVYLRANKGLRKLEYDVDFGELAIKGRSSIGNIVAKHTVRKIEQKEKGVSTLGARKIWFDDTVNKLNDSERGTYLGDFAPEDTILTIYQSGHFRVTGFDLNTHFDEDMVLIEKFYPKRTITAIYHDGDSKSHFIKRFNIETTSDKKTLFISEAEGSYLELATLQSEPVAEIIFTKVKGQEIKPQKVKLAELIEVKNMKAKGNKLSPNKVKEVSLLTPEEKPVKGAEEFEESGESPMEKLKKKVRKRR